MCSFLSPKPAVFDVENQGIATFLLRSDTGQMMAGVVSSDIERCLDKMNFLSKNIDYIVRFASCPCGLLVTCSISRDPVVLIKE